ncbi:envelope glycoprotein I [Cervid alphaherpesvirus 3]|uniref:Envelope glycoprotein I n=1 Tax=Cervid alphaherpesvirus 3 TaxID=2115790 RepID=A0A455JIR9_9ALPH|nr:envelope glycoprotein I [Cervid alphaherpesvirus 3]AVT50651.1 envelope glycoprotein I [Cervid alphaherpesvirus 3]
MRCLLLWMVAALAARAPLARGLVYRGGAVALRADGPAAFAVHPADATLALRGRLVFLEHQLPAGRRYNGTVELLRYHAAGDCFLLLQTTAFASCPRVANDAFRSCLHADARPGRGERRAGAAVERHVLLAVDRPRPADSGLYFLRVGVDAEDGARRADAFPLAAFVHSFAEPGGPAAPTAPADANADAEASGPRCERGPDALDLYDRALAVFPGGDGDAAPAPPSPPGASARAAGVEAGDGAEDEARGSAAGSTAPAPARPTPDAPRTPSAAGAAAAAARPTGDTPARFQRRLVSILVPLCVLVLLLLALCAATVNCALRRRLLPCSRRVYKPRPCAACGSGACAGRPPCRGAAPAAAATVVALGSRPKAPPLATICEE